MIEQLRIRDIMSCKIYTYDASQRLSVLKADVLILAHAREIYTPNIFTRFQDEYMKFF